ncbi:MAG: LamG domain-containing protein [Myxococcaceae bacterium]|nr:LamG domain-containing protein [Myxococcaceae bacterium]
MRTARWLAVVVLSGALACDDGRASDPTGSGGGNVGGGNVGGGNVGGGNVGGGNVGGGNVGGGNVGGGNVGGGNVGGGNVGGGNVGGGNVGGGNVGGGNVGGGNVGGGRVGGGNVAGGSIGGVDVGGGNVGGGNVGGGNVGGGNVGGGNVGGGSVGGGSVGGGNVGGSLDGGRPLLDGGLALGAIAFNVNAAGADDYGVLTALPPGFGAGEFTFELWIRPDPAFPTGLCTDGTAGQRTQWCSPDPAPGSSSDWWFKGNFLLDGHNNMSFSAGTFSLQLVGAGRVRWQLGDQGSTGPGATWGVQAHPSATVPSLLDGRWHHLACIRRWQGATQARLELWVDGVLTGTQVSDVRTNLATIWSAWSGFPTGEAGWFLGAEKQSALGSLSQYEDYKGLLSELRFWTRPLQPGELAPPSFARSVSGSEPGLVGWFRFGEGAGTTACDTLAPTRCITFQRVQPPFWR